MCSGPFRGASGTQQLARLHRKGPHRLEAWRSGPFSKSRTLRRIYRSLLNTNYFSNYKSISTTQTPIHYRDTHRFSIPTGAIFRTGIQFLKVTHSRGLRPLPPTPRKRCRRNVSWEAPQTVLRSPWDPVSDSESAAGGLSGPLKVVPDPPSRAPGRKHRPPAGFRAFQRCRA